MHLEPHRTLEDQHAVLVENRREGLRIARAMGIFRYSGLKMSFVSVFCGHELEFRTSTANLQTIESRFRPPSPELTDYIAQLAMPEPAEVVEPVILEAVA